LLRPLARCLQGDPPYLGPHEFLLFSCLFFCPHVSSSAQLIVYIEMATSTYRTFNNCCTGIPMTAWVCIWNNNVLLNWFLMIFFSLSVPSFCRMLAAVTCDSEIASVPACWSLELFASFWVFLPAGYVWWLKPFFFQGEI
jgi:hypothetical protein